MTNSQTADSSLQFVAIGDQQTLVDQMLEFEDDLRLWTTLPRTVTTSAAALREIFDEWPHALLAAAIDNDGLVGLFWLVEVELDASLSARLELAAPRDGDTKRLGAAISRYCDRVMQLRPLARVELQLPGSAENVIENCRGHGLELEGRVANGWFEQGDFVDRVYLSAINDEFIASDT